MGTSGKIKRLSTFNDEDFLEVYELVLRNITILEHSIVPLEQYRKAFTLCQDIDSADTAFVAFSGYLKCNIWTGDKKLINGLSKKGFSRITTTADLHKDFIRKKSSK